MAEILTLLTDSRLVFPRVVETMPVIPNQAFIVCLLAGVRFPSRDEESEQQYLQKCSEKGIIPVSTVTLERSLSGLVFTAESFVRAVGYSDKLRSAATAAIFTAGTRINEIRADLRGQADWEVFRREYLDILLEGGYEIERALFNFNALTGEEAIRLSKAGLLDDSLESYSSRINFNPDGINVLEDKITLSAWYAELRQKFV